ncbi:TIGR02301 family protein [Pseudorhizobium flavum]|jgi:uncharacterized protein (TIGR02301 family)|uniref:TIGR02301 family protein n=1 Tax=Pseudorhizobium flavum TaxID=1335061 RepID=UPI00377076C7
MPSRLLAGATLLSLIAFAVPPLAAQEAVPPPATPGPATAPAQEDKPAPYDQQLSRLAEILGSLHYLRTLCGETSDDWRTAMQDLLNADTESEPKRRERLTAAFNRGYRSFAAVHTTCTDAARTAEERHRNEGATLAGEIAARFGN